jgi:hypothetical protein
MTRPGGWPTPPISGRANAWEHVRGKNPDDLTFKVGGSGSCSTSRRGPRTPTSGPGRFSTRGSDVVISGLDAPEALNRGRGPPQGRADAYALPYTCTNRPASLRPRACLGVPYFNLGAAVSDHAPGGGAPETYQPAFRLAAPGYFADMNDPDTSPAGFYARPRSRKTPEGSRTSLRPRFGAGGLT